MRNLKVGCGVFVLRFKKGASQQVPFTFGKREVPHAQAAWVA